MAKMRTSLPGLIAYLFVLPGLLIYLAFYFLPTLEGMLLGFFDWNGVGRLTFIGFDNYIEMFNDARFLQTLFNSIGFMLVTIIPAILGLVCATILFQGKLKGSGLFRTVFYMPSIISSVAVGITWRWIFDPNYGLLNNLPKLIGLPNLKAVWFGDPNLAFAAIVVIFVWCSFGYAMVIYLAGLQKIDTSLYEAARVDGANVWHQFRLITVPQLRAETTVVLVLFLISSLKILPLIQVTTRGGPGYSTYVIGLFAYNMAFRQFRYGYGAAISTFLTLIALVCSWIMLKLRERREAA